MTSAAGRDSSGYTAKDLSVLEGLEAVRKRPGMYIGSTDSKGLTHLAFEVIDNSVDEALAGHCNRIEVVVHEDGSLEVHDDGRGIPVDVNAKTGLTGVELVLTKLHAGGKFGGTGYKTSGGLHGVGASVVNALSARMDVSVRKDGRVHAMSFQRGVAGVFKGDGPQADFTPARRALDRRQGAEGAERHVDPLVARHGAVRQGLGRRHHRRPRPAAPDRLPRPRARSRPARRRT